jgi:hypothetical protein
MTNVTRLLLPLAAVVSLAGCASNFEARVARFQQMPPQAGQSFTIAPRDKENVGSLEFAAYANLVRQRLLAKGFTEAVTPEQAYLTVLLDYNVGPPREAIRTRPGWGGAGMGPGWGGGWGGGWGWNPYWGRGWGGAGWGGWGGGWGNEVYSVTQFTSTVAMKIVRQADNTSLFEGRAESVGTSNNLTQIVPNLVTAMFADFPGNNGETVRVRFNPARPDVAPTIRPGR